MSNFYDVIIIGASVAGSCAAIELGKHNLKVALIDKATFPRRKPCGEGLSPVGLSHLERMGIKEKVLSYPHLNYSGYRITANTCSKFLPSPLAGGITIQRSLLDAAILKSALEYESVSPYLTSNVQNIVGNSVYLTEKELKANKIVLACGSNSPLLNKIPCEVKRYGPSRTGISTLYRGAYSKTVNWITIIIRNDFEIYCTPLADGYLNVSILKRSNNLLNIRSFFDDESFINDILKECHFTGSQYGLPLGRTNIGNITRTCLTPNILLAGDAKEEFDPIGGMGMSHAMGSGIQTAHEILGEIDNSNFDQKFSKSSKTEYACKISTMRFFTRLTYKTLRGANYFSPILSLPTTNLGRKYFKIILEGCV